MNSLPQVSCGIAAYNEERNIQNVIKDILTQCQLGWQLKEILVYCDGCSDTTAIKARELNNPLVKVLESSDRRGKVYGVSQIASAFSGDILAIFDADIRFKDADVITSLIKPLLAEEAVVLTGGNTRPYEPNGFFQRAVYSTFLVFDDSRKNIKGGNNIFGCTGACLALKKDFVKNLVWKKVLNEDDFLYFSCISQNKIFRHVSQAVVYYKLPTNLKDYLRQVFRSNPEAVEHNLKPIFGDLVVIEYRRPFFMRLKATAKVFFSQPAEVLYISFINLFCKPFFGVVSRNYKLSWFTAESTK